MSSESPNKALVRICLFAALIAALGVLPRIDLPIAAGVPITAQTMGVMLCGLVLGARNGALAVALFVLVVALGMPFLAGGRGGLGVFAAPSAGFLVGFIPGAFVTGMVAASRDDPGSRKLSAYLRGFAASIIGGIVTIYAFGILWLSFSTGMTFKVAAYAAAVFLPGDILKALLAAWLAVYFRSTNVPRNMA